MPASDVLPTVDDRRGALASRFEAAAGVLLCLDFDGTLAPIVDDPDDAAMDAACRAAVSHLARLSTARVALISGRAIDDLRDRVGLDGVAYAGNHGLELHRDEQTEVHPRAAEYRDAIDDVCAVVEAETASIDGCLVEHKGVTATVHYRQVADEDVETVVRAVESAVSDADGYFDVLDGKEILEVRPRVDWDKGRVVDQLAADVPDDWEMVYVGDDATDEDAFRIVEPGGLGVLVGESAETAASVCVPDQSGVVDFLELVEGHLDEESPDPPADPSP